MSISLIPDIPKEEVEYFNNFYITCSKLMALKKLCRGNIFYYKSRFKRINTIIDKGMFKEARGEMDSFIIELKRLNI